MTETGGYLRVRNLERYQHYKDRCPPWIKLHAKILEDYDFGRLPDASKAHALLLLPLAARLGNRIPADPEWIASRIQARSPVDLGVLIAARFLEVEHGASAALDARGQSADSETEREAEQRERQTVTVPRVERTGPRKKLDLLAYADALSELWPLQPMPDRLGVEQELFAQTDRLPDFETFRDNCAEWFRSESWRDREPKHIGSPVSFLRKGTHLTAPPKAKRTTKAAPTVEDVRHQLIDWIFAQGLQQSEIDSFVERAKVAASVQELRVIEEEAGRARVA